MAVFLQVFVWLPLHFSVRQRPRLVFRCSAFVVVPSTVPSSLPPAVFARRGRPGESNLEERISGGEALSLNGSYDLNMYVGWLVSWQFRR